MLRGALVMIITVLSFFSLKALGVGPELSFVLAYFCGAGFGIITYKKL